MNYVEKPNISNIAVLKSCISNVDSATLREKVENNLRYFERSEKKYIELANENKLYELESSLLINESITKKDMVFLYSKMVNKDNPAREFYDRIRTMNLICPMCGCKETKTLDHYLPKALYPEFAVNPSNLIACCRDCNTQKASSIQTESNGTLHPYFDDVADVQWLFAKVTLHPIIGFTYYVKKPTEWEEKKFNKVQNHFEKFKLDETFGIMASEEYSGSYDMFNDFMGKTEELKRLLKSFYNSNKNKNHWKTAFYGALLESDEYISRYEGVLEGVN